MDKTTIPTDKTILLEMDFIDFAEWAKNKEASINYAENLRAAFTDLFSNFNDLSRLNQRKAIFLSNLITTLEK